MSAAVINTRKLRYTGGALAAFKAGNVDANLRTHDNCDDHVGEAKTDAATEPETTQTTPTPSGRVWLSTKYPTPPPQPTAGRHIGTYALTSKVAPWVQAALASYTPTPQVLDFVKPFAEEFHALVERERASSKGLHDLDAIELTYQCTLEISAAILLAGNETDAPVDLALGLHASQAGGDDHFKPWGRLLTGLECDPPIIVQFPFYLLMCQSFTFEPNWHKEDYVYSALTGVDWARGNNKFNDRLAAFEVLARSAVPTLDDTAAGDRCFWRIALAYLRAMNDCENARPLKTPRAAAIQHDLSADVVIAARAFDTIGSAFQSRDGAAWLDDAGIDSMLGSALPNDIMDLHTDIFTGETRNLLRLLCAPKLSMDAALGTMGTMLSAMLCEVFRGHHRAWKHNREDARISSTSPPYSLSRARHRRVFETLELYMDKYPQFWEWTLEIYRQAKTQITEAGMAEPLVCGIKRAVAQGKLPDAPANHFFGVWYDMVEDGAAQLAKKQPLGVGPELAPVVRGLHTLWHAELRDASKAPGWGREFDRRSDMLLGEAGEILGRREGISEETYKFTVAYGRLSMSLPYIAYHTVAAIILVHGAIPLA